MAGIRAGGKTRLESRIKKFKPHIIHGCSVCRRQGAAVSGRHGNVRLEAATVYDHAFVFGHPMVGLLCSDTRWLAFVFGHPMVGLLNPIVCVVWGGFSPQVSSFIHIVKYWKSYSN